MRDGAKIEREVLPNGLTLVVERMAHFPSVTAGVWVKRGSRQEPASANGVNHFIEHLVFKGTPTRSYQEIYKTFDRMGGVLDAFTSREIMGFYFRVQKAHFPEAFEVLSDMLAHPTIPDEELERERGVILEEIKMVNDSPSDLVADLYLERAYPNHSLGRPIQGTAESVGAMSRRQVLSHYHAIMRPEHLVVTATGDTTLAELRRHVEPVLAKLRPGPIRGEKQPVFRPGVTVFQRNHLEQAQIVIGFEGERASGRNRFALMVLANLLGGTMSSRLFTEIRERRGLVYSISAEHMSFMDAGIFVVQAATSHDKAARTLRETLTVLADLAKDGVGEEELTVAKENLLGGLILSLESPSSRMGRLARNELYFSRQRPVTEMIRGVERTDERILHKLARRIFRPERALIGVLGRESAVKGAPLSILDGKP